MKHRQVMAPAAAVLCAATLFAGVPAPIAAQRLLSLEARTGAGPDALAAGPIAVFWNPALAVPSNGGLADALVLDLRAPESTGLSGLVLAGTLRLDGRTAVGLGYMHASVDGIRRTTTSPLSDGDEGEIDVSENVVALSLARRLGQRTEFGAALRYGKTAEIAGGDAVYDMAAGIVVQPLLPWSPRIGGSIEVEDDDFDWNAGVGVTAPFETSGWTFGARYGLGGTHRVHGITHRAGAEALWDGGVDVEAGVAIEPDGDGHAVTPVLGAGFALNRYHVGVLRESLANGLGAIYSFRFGVTFE